ncbi:lipid A export permease/ATP-binding protein MsbA [Desulforhabdus sp. TSK]|uniref:lipid A export permease/ATP-binding protein MsbA n=1 Tax=Desulforhabdus sp. TSK TaxID=2925014 RepID=UPI001FC826B7|nr:lipid A export permease/ATP-binding protein MsbA [Desulforhabdus sp. TSK]GKT09366.1 ABC transporter ATP-binding protein [Desulforhabdus sp. TSK]
MNIYRRMFQYVKPHRNRLALAMVCMMGIAACTAASAYLIKPVLDDIFMNKQMDMLKILSAVVLFMFILKGVCAWGNSYLMNAVGQHIIARLRQQIYDHIQSLSLSFFDRTPTGTLMSRITNDVAQIQGAVSDAVTGLLKDSFSIVGLVGVIFYRDWKLASMAVIILPFAFYPIIKFGRMLRRFSRKSQQSIGDLSVILHETLGGARIVKAFGMEDYERARFGRENQKFLDYMMKSVSVRALSSPVMELLGGLGIVFIIWYGGYNVIMGVSTPGSFFSFMAALLMLYEPVKRLSNMNNTLQQGVAAAYRVFDILDTEPEIQDKPDARILPPIRQGIQLQHVHFRYGEEPVLQDISLEVPAGKIVALVGVSGSGKTTLVNLIPRFYEVTEGAILIDGIDIRDVTLASLRSQIGIVTQQSILFNDSVRSNIAYGSIHKSEEEITAAAKAANAYDFIMKMPQGFDTSVGEQGTLLSGGERQRLCIARALLKNAPILILDEATSSLDSESELEVQKALENLMAGRTTLVIAHRLSTIMHADLIVALVDGKIVEQGCHEDLLQRNGEYHRLYHLQFSHMEASGEPFADISKMRGRAD